MFLKCLLSSIIMNDYSTGGGEAPAVGEAIFQKRAELNQEIIDGIGPNS